MHQFEPEPRICKIVAIGLLLSSWTRCVWKVAFCIVKGKKLG